MAQAFLHGGGTDPLNFKVIGGTSAPANPRENDIWVNTNTPVIGWDFCTEKPYRRSGNRNLITYPFYHTTRTESGITYTDNKDGTITANGTATANAVFRISATNDNDENHNLIFLPKGTYTFSGCPKGGSTSTYFWEIFEETFGADDIRLGRDFGNGATFTLDHDCVVRCALAVISGATVSNLVFKPQLERGSAATSFVKGDATGHLWIHTGDSSNIEWNALKKNGLQVYPLAANQYVSGAWVTKPTKIYQGGAWKDWWSGELYTAGDEWTGITGGWVAKNTGSLTTGTLENKNSVLTATALINRCVWATTANKINLSNYKTLSVKVTSRGSTGTCSFGYSEGNSWNAASDMVARTEIDTGKTGTFTLDISKVTGEYYVCLRMANSSTSNSGTVSVSEVKLV